jgi:cytosine/creatinine deaminase
MRRLLLRSEARLPEGAGFRDIGIAGGRIRRIAPRPTETAASEIATGGRLVIPGPVESHFHLDKALLGAGAPHWTGTVQGAIRATAEASACSPWSISPRGPAAPPR